MTSSAMITLQCLRCNTALTYAGTKDFHEGSKMSEWFLGVFGEGRETYDMYYCPKCGKVEFFVDGIGEELRSE